MPTARAWTRAAAGNNGKVYVAGGTDETNIALNTVLEYDPATDTWTSRAPMPTARKDLGLAKAGNGRLYAIGGRASSGDTSTPLATVEEYNPDTNSWATRASMPTPRERAGVVAGLDGKVYVIGGDNNGSLLATTEVYDPASDTWSVRADIPTARDLLTAVAANNGRIYAIGGIPGCCVPVATVEEYDPVTDSWVTRASMPTARYELGAALGGDGRIYVVGGHGSAHNPREDLSTVEVYDPATDSWSTGPSMPSARTAMGVATVNGASLYAIGGQVCCGPTILNTVVELGPLGTHLISGRVTDSSGKGIAGVTISAQSRYSVTTGASGYYTLTGLITGTYTLTAASRCYAFSPPQRVVAVPPDATGQDFTGVSTCAFLPCIIRNWPPLPGTPTLNPITARSFDSFDLAWSTADRATSYTLQEDGDSSFPHPTAVFSGDSTTWQASGKAPGTYCYRVKGSNEYGDGPWSNVQCATISLVQDDFSDPKSGWPIASDAVASVGYTSGEYRILVKQAGSLVRVGAGISVTDFLCEVDARNAAHINGSYGITFGASDTGFYLYEVAYGEFRLSRYDRWGNTWVTLIGKTQHQAIHQGDQTNRLKVIRRGAEIALYANGEQVGQVTDGTLGQGTAGVAAGAFGANYDARFDNFALTYLATATRAPVQGGWMDAQPGPAVPFR